MVQTTITFSVLALALVVYAGPVPAGNRRNVNIGGIDINQLCADGIVDGKVDGIAIGQLCGGGGKTQINGVDVTPLCDISGDAKVVNGKINDVDVTALCDKAGVDISGAGAGAGAGKNSGVVSNNGDVVTGDVEGDQVIGNVSNKNTGKNADKSNVNDSNDGNKDKLVVGDVSGNQVIGDIINDVDIKQLCTDGIDNGQVNGVDVSKLCDGGIDNINGVDVSQLTELCDITGDAKVLKGKINDTDVVQLCDSIGVDVGANN